MRSDERPEVGCLQACGQVHVLHAVHWRFAWRYTPPCCVIGRTVRDPAAGCWLQGGMQMSSFNPERQFSHQACWARAQVLPAKPCEPVSGQLGGGSHPRVPGEKLTLAALRGRPIRTTREIHLGHTNGTITAEAHPSIWFGAPASKAQEEVHLYVRNSHEPTRSFK